MASLNLAGKTSGYVKLQAPDDSSTNPTVTLPTESGELALKSDIGEGGGSGGDSIWTEEGDIAKYDGKVSIKKDLIIETDGFGVSWGRDNGSPRIYAEEDGELNFRHGGGSSAMKIDSAGHLLIGEDGWNGGASNKSGLAIQATSSDSSPFAMYITNSNNSQIFSVRCDGSTRASKLYLGDDKVDLRAELNLKDKLIEKLSARLDELEKKLKK